MRLAQLLPVWGLAGWACTAAWAQTSVPPVSETPARPVAAWLDPAAPSRPLRHLPLPHSGTVVDGPRDWRAAHAAVAEFPNGHADVVRWEAAQPRFAPAQAWSVAPTHEGHP